GQRSQGLAAIMSDPDTTLRRSDIIRIGIKGIRDDRLDCASVCSVRRIVAAAHCVARACGRGRAGGIEDLVDLSLCKGGGWKDQRQQRKPSRFAPYAHYSPP